MATREEKINELRKRLGPDHEKDLEALLSKAEQTEKSAEQDGIPYALKTKKRMTDADDELEGENIPPVSGKKPAMSEAEAESESQEESEEDSDAEAIEDSAEEDVEAEAGDESEEEEDKELKDNPAIHEIQVGSMRLGEFANLVSEAMAAALDPYLAEQKELRGVVSKLQEKLTTTEKERDENLSIFEDFTKDMASMTKQIQELKAMVNELSGNAPAAVREGFIASQSEETVRKTKEAPAEAVTESYKDFFNFVTSHNP